MWSEFYVNENISIDKINERFFFLEFRDNSSSTNKNTTGQVVISNLDFAKKYCNKIKIEYTDINTGRQVGVSYNNSSFTNTLVWSFNKETVSCVGVEYFKSFFTELIDSEILDLNENKIDIKNFPSNSLNTEENKWFNFHNGYLLENEKFLGKEKTFLINRDNKWVNTIFNNKTTNNIKINESPFNLIKTPVNAPIPQKTSRGTVPFESLWKSNENNFSGEFYITIRHDGIKKDDSSILTDVDLNKEFKNNVIYFALQSSGGLGTDSYADYDGYNSYHAGGGGGSGAFAVIAIKKYLLTNAEYVRIHYDNGNITVVEKRIDNNSEITICELTKGGDANFNNRADIPSSADFGKGLQYILGGSAGEAKINASLDSFKFAFPIFLGNGHPGEPGCVVEDGDAYRRYPSTFSWDDTSDWFEKYTSYKNFFLNTYPSNCTDKYPQSDFAVSCGTPSYCSYVTPTSYIGNSTWDTHSHGFGGGAAGAGWDNSPKKGESNQWYKQTSGISGAIFFLKTF